MRAYRDILRIPGALTFSLAGLLARFPMSMNAIGIVLMVSAIYDSYGLAGAVSAAYIIAQAVCSPIIARMVDRFGQSRIMRPAIIACAVSESALVAVAAVEAPTWTLFPPAILTGATIGSLGALVRARWNHVLKTPDQIHTAYSLESAFDELGFVIGPVLATVLATSLTPTAALIVPVFELLIGGFLFLSQKRTEPPAMPRHHSGKPEGGMLLLNPVVAAVCLTFLGVGALFGATDVTMVAVTEAAGVKQLAGPILGIFAAGSLVAGLAYGARHWNSALWKRFVVGIVALAIGSSLFFFAANLWILAGTAFVVGFSIAPSIINGNSMVQQTVPRSRLTEGLTWTSTSMGIGVSIGSSLGGLLIDDYSAHAGFIAVSSAAALALVVVVASIPVLRRNAHGHSLDEENE